MSTDYPEKCHVRFLIIINKIFFLSFQQFNHVWQQKRRTFSSTYNHSTTPPTPTLLSASISNHLSSIQSLNTLDNGDKNRSSVCYYYFC
jgi:hypothetical protein